MIVGLFDSSSSSSRFPPESEVSVVTLVNTSWRKLSHSSSENVKVALARDLDKIEKLGE